MAILFEEDWLSHPTAIPHFSTTNKSWVEFAVLLKKMGVKNHLFHLALLNPELENVDPFDPNLDFETKNLIRMEAQFNPWYFFREIVRVPPQAGPNPVPLRANRGNISMYWCFFNHIDYALVQIRQTGKSISADCLFTGLMYVFSSNTTMGLFTKDDALRRSNVDRLKRSRDFLPPYIYTKNKLDIDNQSEFSYETLQNHYKTAVGQKSEIGANNIGRGFTMPVQQYDETAFISLLDITMPAALAAGNAAREEAALYDNPYGNLYTTTAGRKDTRVGKYVYKFFHKAAPWVESFYDAKNEKELHQLVLTNGKGRKLMIHGVFNHRQLGKSDEWLAKTLAENNASGPAANMDFFNIWESGSEVNPIDPKKAEVIRDSERDAYYNHICREYYILKWYIPEDQIETYMDENCTTLGLDTSEAIGRDGIGFVLSSVVNMETICTMSINETNLYRFGKFLAWFMCKYKKVTLIIEKKSSAQNIIDTLLIELPKLGEDPFKRIFNRVVDEAPKESPDYKSVVDTPMSRRHPEVYSKYKKYFGFNTTGDSRKLLYGTVLSAFAAKAAGMVYDKTLIQELLGLVIRDGRVDHSESGNDDMVVAVLMSEWFVTHAKNLRFYGIDPLSIKTASYKKVEAMPLEEQLKDFEQEQLQEEINEIWEQLRNTFDAFKVARLESKIYRLSSQLVESDEDYLSIDAMLEQAALDRENKRKSMRVNRRY